MNNDILPLDNFLSFNSTWTLDFDDIIHVTYEHGDIITNHVISETYLLQYHQALPLTIWVILEHNNGSARGEIVERYVSFLMNKYPEFPAAPGERGIYREITDLFFQKDDIRIRGKFWFVRTKIIDGVEVPYDLHEMDGVFVNTKEQIETKHPGWHERYAIGKELGLDNTHLYNFLFLQKESSTKPSNLCDLQFD